MLMQRELSVAIITLLIAGSNAVFSIKCVSGFDTKLKLEPQEIHLCSDVNHAGDEFVVSIVAEDVSDFYDWEFVLIWTPKVINCTGETINTGIWGDENFLGPWVAMPINNTDGTYHQSVTGRAPGTPKDGTFWLVNLTFIIVAEPGHGEVVHTQLHLEKAEGYTAFCLLGTGGAELPHDYVDGSYTYEWGLPFFSLLIQVEPTIPPPNIYMEVEVTVSFRTRDFHEVEFGNFSRIANNFEVDVNISETSESTENPLWYEHTYNLGFLPKDTYLFMAYLHMVCLNGTKGLLDSAVQSITVFGAEALNIAQMGPLPSVVASRIDAVPTTLNLLRPGSWIQVYVEAPEGFDLSRVNISSVMLDQTIPADQSVATILGDYDGDLLQDLLIKFNRSMVSNFIISSGVTTGNVAISMTYRLYDGTKFKGTGIVRVRMPGDVNVDGIVNGQDAVILGVAFASREGQPNWNPTADENEDTYINAKDVILIGNNFGHIYS